jgi:uncharacterized protein YmfQ (DUF2313 family)
MDSEKFTFEYDGREICLLDSLPQIYHPISDYRAISNVSGKEVCDLYQGVKRILDDNFISTSSEASISKWEKYLKLVPNGTDTLEERRFRILAKLNDYPPYTDQYLVNKLTELCGAGNFSIKPDYNNYKLEIWFSLASTTNEDTILDVLKSLIPANIELSIMPFRSRYSELSAFTHDTLASYTHAEIETRVPIEH